MSPSSLDQSSTCMVNKQTVHSSNDGPDSFYCRTRTLRTRALRACALHTYTTHACAMRWQRPARTHLPAAGALPAVRLPVSSAPLVWWVVGQSGCAHCATLLHTTFPAQPPHLLLRAYAAATRPALRCLQRLRLCATQHFCDRSLPLRNKPATTRGTRRTARCACLFLTWQAPPAFNTVTARAPPHLRPAHYAPAGARAALTAFNATPRAAAPSFLDHPQHAYAHCALAGVP